MSFACGTKGTRFFRFICVSLLKNKKKKQKNSRIKHATRTNIYFATERDDTARCYENRIFQTKVRTK